MLDDYFERSNVLRPTVYNPLPSFPSMPYFPTVQAVQTNEKVVLAEHAPEGLIELMHEKLLIDHEARLIKYEQETDEILLKAGNTFASIYASKVSAEDYAKVKRVSAEVTPEEKSFWGTTTKGRGISITIHK